MGLGKYTFSIGLNCQLINILEWVMTCIKEKKKQTCFDFLGSPNPNLVEVALCLDLKATVPAFYALSNGRRAHIWPMVSKRKLLKAT